MRIIAGSCRGRRLKSPENRSIRPTSDRIRESVFNILGNRVEGACVLDLFAGTGALGLESLSRGASSSLFVDIARGACKIIRENIDLCRFSHHADVVAWDMSGPSLPRQLLETRDGYFHLIFMDPPYNSGLAAKCLGNSSLVRCLADDGIIIAEHSLNESLHDNFGGLQLSDRRQYGNTLISFFCFRP
ncbi:MAG: 16S rRNA (guanine(966)-N(2))-methyltransferase RsmD [Desulfamplus sp.]|nr:16S rRNA (guanine(966)-N(2))-methyltransferase RsmD [Desulfamplus sp.]